MLKAAVTASVLALLYLCQRPELIGRAGLILHLRGHGLPAWLSKQAYRSATRLYELIHQRLPGSRTDEIARFAWLDRDAELVVRVQTAIHELTGLQTSEVPIQWTALPAYTELFEQLRLSYPDFSDWHNLGFQGQNPATDFRGVGRLGLLLFHGFCTTHTNDLQRILLESRSATENNAQQQWYPLALVSIRLSMALCEALKREKLLVVGLLQQTSDAKPVFAVVQRVHDKLLFDFHALWLESVQRGDVKTYFDNEAVLKTFEQGLPLAVYELGTNLS